jgi:hypothetical protein
MQPKISDLARSALGFVASIAGFSEPSSSPASS